VKAGYKLRIYDFDNLLGSLAQFVMKECPDKMSNVAYQTFTDKMKGNANPVQMIGARLNVQPLVDGIPKAFANALVQLNHWKTPTEDLGVPSTWGPDTVVVIDSLTAMCSAAFRYVQGMNPLAKEPQAQYFAAQQLIVNVLALLASEQFNVNVLVLAHIAYDKNHLEITKGFPRSIGSALNSQIGAFFNCVLMVESQGGGRRVIQTESNGVVDLKNPISFKVGKTLPLESGMADFFKAVTSQ
jgi:hypothetical protein